MLTHLLKPTAAQVHNDDE